LAINQLLILVTLTHNDINRLLQLMPMAYQEFVLSDHFLTRKRRQRGEKEGNSIGIRRFLYTKLSISLLGA